MKKRIRHEYSCGAVLYTRKGGNLLYVLVMEKNGNIGFPKGHRESGETEKETALREIWEETGVRARLKNNFKIAETYPRGLSGEKHVTYFLAKFDSSARVHRGDDIRRVMVLPFERALEKLTYDSAKVILRRAHRRLLAERIVGRRVTVQVDRPMNSSHPEYPDTVYPINYGHVTTDGDEQGAYIVGVNEPVAELCGRVIAVILRVDDTEDKWVVAPPGQNVSKKDIASLVDFQEKYFESEIVM